jgi:hypothetical protein
MFSDPEWGDPFFTSDLSRYAIEHLERDSTTRCRDTCSSAASREQYNQSFSSDDKQFV